MTIYLYGEIQEFEEFISNARALITCEITRIGMRSAILGNDLKGKENFVC